jgi:hypothetical protein
MRMEYDISIVFEMSENGTQTTRPLNAVFAPVFPSYRTEEGAQLEVMRYRLRGLELPSDQEDETEPEKGLPWGWIIVILLVLAGVGAGLYFRKKKRGNV